jgi:hypothetical protein
MNIGASTCPTSPLLLLAKSSAHSSKPFRIGHPHRSIDTTSSIATVATTIATTITTITSGHTLN